MPDVSPSGHGSGALSFMPVRGSCVPCSGALSDSQGSPASRERLLCGICSERCGAGRAPQDSTEESVSDACGLLRPCRRSGTPRGIPAAEAVLRALTFSALGAPSGNRTTAAETLPGTPEIHCILVHACYPALAILTVKTAEKVNPDLLFALRNACRASLPAIDNCL